MQNRKFYPIDRPTKRTNWQEVILLIFFYSLLFVMFLPVIIAIIK